MAFEKKSNQEINIDRYSIPASCRHSVRVLETRKPRENRMAVA
jgi:hypothetical protein